MPIHIFYCIYSGVLGPRGGIFPVTGNRNRLLRAVLASRAPGRTLLTPIITHPNDVPYAILYKGYTSMFRNVRVSRIKGPEEKQKTTKTAHYLSSNYHTVVPHSFTQGTPAFRSPAPRRTLEAWVPVHTGYDMVGKAGLIRWPCRNVLYALYPKMSQTPCDIITHKVNAMMFPTQPLTVQPSLSSSRDSSVVVLARAPNAPNSTQSHASSQPSSSDILRRNMVCHDGLRSPLVTFSVHIYILHTYSCTYISCSILLSF